MHKHSTTLIGKQPGVILFNENKLSFEYLAFTMNPQFISRKFMENKNNLLAFLNALEEPISIESVKPLLTAETITGNLASTSPAAVAISSFLQDMLGIVFLQI